MAGGNSVLSQRHWEMHLRTHTLGDFKHSGKIFWSKNKGLYPSTHHSPNPTPPPHGRCLLPHQGTPLLLSVGEVQPPGHTKPRRRPGSRAASPLPGTPGSKGPAQSPFLPARFPFLAALQPSGCHTQACLHKREPANTLGLR